MSREIKILKKVRHHNVIQLMEVIDAPKQIFLVMELTDSGEVRRDRPEGRLPTPAVHLASNAHMHFYFFFQLFKYIVRKRRLREPDAARLFHDIVDGVDYLHTVGVIHRDLKPENLLMSRNKDGRYRIKVIDFGLSNIQEKGRVLKTACGSPCYAAPEMIAGHRYDGTRSDWWSLGVVLFAMVAGYLPFEDANTAALYDKILNARYTFPTWLSPACKDLISRMLNTNPRSRYTAADIRKHPWYTQVTTVPPAVTPFPDRPAEIDSRVLDKIVKLGVDAGTLKQSVERRSHNHATTTYFLVAQRMVTTGELSPREGGGASSLQPPQANSIDTSSTATQRPMSAAAVVSSSRAGSSAAVEPDSLLADAYETGGGGSRGGSRRPQSAHPASSLPVGKPVHSPRDVPASSLPPSEQTRTQRVDTMDSIPTEASAGAGAGRAASTRLRHPQAQQDLDVSGEAEAGTAAKRERPARAASAHPSRRNRLADGTDSSSGDDIGTPSEHARASATTHTAGRSASVAPGRRRGGSARPTTALGVRSPKGADDVADHKLPSTTEASAEPAAALRGAVSGGTGSASTTQAQGSAAERGVSPDSQGHAAAAAARPTTRRGRDGSSPPGAAAAPAGSSAAPKVPPLNMGALTPARGAKVIDMESPAVVLDSNDDFGDAPGFGVGQYSASGGDESPAGRGGRGAGGGMMMIESHPRNASRAASGISAEQAAQAAVTAKLQALEAEQAARREAERASRRPASARAAPKPRVESSVPPVTREHDQHSEHRSGMDARRAGTADTDGGSHATAAGRSDGDKAKNGPSGGGQAEPSAPTRPSEEHAARKQGRPDSAAGDAWEGASVSTGASENSRGRRPNSARRSRPGSARRRARHAGKSSRSRPPSASRARAAAAAAYSSVGGVSDSRDDADTGSQATSSTGRPSSGRRTPSTYGLSGAVNPITRTNYNYVRSSGYGQGTGPGGAGPRASSARRSRSPRPGSASRGGGANGAGGGAVPALFTYQRRTAPASVDPTSAYVPGASARSARGGGAPAAAPPSAGPSARAAAAPSRGRRVWSLRPTSGQPSSQAPSVSAAAPSSGRGSMRGRYFGAVSSAANGPVLPVHTSGRGAHATRGGGAWAEPSAAAPASAYFGEPSSARYTRPASAVPRTSDSARGAAGPMYTGSRAESAGRARQQRIVSAGPMGRSMNGAPRTSEASAAPALYAQLGGQAAAYMGARTTAWGTGGGSARASSASRGGPALRQPGIYAR